MRSIVRAACLVGTCVVTVFGCSSSSKTVESPGTSELKVTFGPVTVQPGEERTQCVVKRLSNDGAVHVGQITNVLGTSSHHLIVYKVNDIEEQTTPFDCRPFKDTLDPSKGTPLMITQKSEETLTLPPGVAYTIDPHQMVRLEMHFINPTSAATTLVSSSTFTPIDDASFHDEAGFLFIGNPDISLKPRADTTLGPTYFPLPPEYADVKFYAITGHEHQYGTNVTVETAPSNEGAGTSIYDVPGWSWQEPKTVFQDPPFTVPSGGGFRFTCKWTNTSDQTIQFGESAEDEMCFFWAYYYPNKGAKVCLHTDQKAGGYDFCCPSASPACKYIATGF